MISLLERWLWAWNVSRETTAVGKPDVIVGLGGLLVEVGQEDRIWRSDGHDGDGMFHVKHYGQANPTMTRDCGVPWVIGTGGWNVSVAGNEEDRCFT